MRAIDVLDLYFIENRSRILDVASFLDRIDRYEGAEEAKADFRYLALVHILDILGGKEGDRTRAIQMALSDPTTEPLDKALEQKAWGAWKGASE
jgi:hypothetical protein